MELHISKGINNKLENKNGIALTFNKSRFNSISILIYSQPMYIVKICCISFFSIFHFLNLTVWMFVIYLDDNGCHN